MASLIFILALLTVVLSFKGPQTYAAQKATGWLNGKYQLSTSLQGFQYVFPNRFIITDVFVPDAEMDTLIYASKIDLFFTLFDVNANQASLKSVDVTDLKFNWLTEEGDSIAGFKWFIQKFKRKGPRKRRPFGMGIDELKIRNSSFHMENYNCDSCTGLFFNDINLDALCFQLDGPYVNIEVRTLGMEDHRGISVKNLSGELAYQQNYIQANKLNLITANSHIHGDYRLDFKDLKPDFKDFINQVSISARVESSVFSSEELQAYAPKLPDLNSFKIHGDIDGMVNDFAAEQLKVEVASSTLLEGDFTIKNVTNVNLILIEAPLFKVESNIDDAHYLFGLFSDSTLPDMASSFEEVSFQGSFKGKLEAFSSKGVFSSNIGGVEIDLDLTDLKSSNPTYKGKILFSQFNIGSLLNTKALGSISANFNIDGLGFNPMTMNTELGGQVSYIYLNQYGYQNIEIDGRFAQGQFMGEFLVDDPNLDFDFSGVASFNQDTSRYKFVAHIDKANLGPLNLSTDSAASLSSELDIDLSAVNYDNWRGDLRIANTSYQNSLDAYFFEDFLISSKGSDTNHNLTVRSNIFDVDINGAFTSFGIFSSLDNYLNQYLKRKTPNQLEREQEFDFNIHFKETKVITQVLFPKLDIKPKTKLFGKFSSKKQELKANLLSKGFTYNGYDFDRLRLSYEGDFDKSKLDLYLVSFKIENGLEIDSISFTNNIYKDSLDYKLLAIVRDSVDAKVDLLGYGIREDTLSFLTSIREAKFNVGYQPFAVSGENNIRIDTSGVFIEGLTISNPKSSIDINGGISDDQHQVLRVNLEGFDMDLVNYFIGNDNASFDGNLYGNVIFSEILKSPKFSARMSIDQMMMNSTLLGDFSFESDWTINNDSIKILAGLDLGELQTLSAEGFYQAQEKGNLSFDIDFDRFKLAAFNPLLAGIAENLRGNLNGGLNLVGTAEDPKLSGKLELPKTAFTVSFLQTDYNLTGSPTVIINTNEILFPDLKIRDTQFGTEGVISGSIYHNGFKNVRMDLKVTGEELLALNTPYTNEDAYYGTAFVDGEVSIQGPPGNLKISSTINTARDTKFNIPLDAATEVKKSDFVTFIDKNKTSLDTSDSQANRLITMDKGIELDFNIGVNQDAELNIILNKETGNQLKAKGIGNIRMLISELEPMQLFGTYTIVEGDYNLSLRGIVNRNFEVASGSSITWNGSPYDAQINITGIYTTKADPSVLASQSESGRTLVEVYLDIKGELTNPQINFQIKAPRANSTVQAVLANRLSNPDKVNQQVFSLLASGSFASDEGIQNSFNPEANAWQILAAQSSAWLNQFIGSEDLDFRLSHQSANQASSFAQTETELDVSYRVSDRLSVETSVGLSTYELDNSTQNQIAGDFEIDYDITRDGRFRAKAFNRAIQNQYTFQNQTYRQGVGVFYKMDFDTWGEFFKRLVSTNTQQTEGTREEQVDVQSE